MVRQVENGKRAKAGDDWFYWIYKQEAGGERADSQGNSAFTLIIINLCNIAHKLVESKQLSFRRQSIISHCSH